MLLIGALEGRRYYLPNQRSLKLSKLNTSWFFFLTCIKIVDLKEKQRRRSIRGIGTQEGKKKTNGKLLPFYGARFEGAKTNFYQKL